jgi:hypothetical protein
MAIFSPRPFMAMRALVVTRLRLGPLDLLESLNGVLREIGVRPNLGEAPPAGWKPAIRRRIYGFGDRAPT